jgi:hypothetical protein
MDYAGNLNSKTIEYDVVPPVDVTAPEITTDWVDSPSGWTNRDDIRFTATDADSGVAAIVIERAGSVLRVPQESAVFTLVPGTQSIEFWAEDEAGNTSAHQTITVKADFDGPDITTEPFGSIDTEGRIEVVQGSTVPFVYACTDADSGIAECTSDRTSGAPLDTAHLGHVDLVVEALDLAGNRERVQVRYEVVAAPAGPTDPSGPSGPTDPTGPAVPAEPTSPAPGSPEPSSPGTGDAGSPNVTSGGSITSTGSDSRLAETGLAPGWTPWIAAAGLVLGGWLIIMRRRALRP